MVVDDEDDMNYLISSILKKLHIKILFAATISEGLKMITSFPTIDLVFLDNRLPDGLGSQYIREFKNNSNRYVVVMSAYDTTYDRRMAENNGADGFMGKPFTRDQMTNVVYKLLSAPAD
ncbi:MAG: response regulator [Chitinophagaceae bacterium]|nr:response regulator [Chitinophagaceae bacterium]MCW5928274.1 response regulator [Chitinophagaceae bacterium]